MEPFMNSTAYDLPERVAGLLICLAIGWSTILKPAWFGLLQMLGRVDPLAEAMAGLRSALAWLFVDIKGLAEASKSELLVTVGAQSLEDLFGGNATQVVHDVDLLIRRGKATFDQFQGQWLPQFKAVRTESPQRVISAVHGFWSWLRSAEVAPVLEAAARRFGLEHALLEKRQREIQKIVQKHAPNLAHGFWYGLYAVLVCQFLLLEAAFAIGHPRLLFWVALGLAAFNLSKLGLFLWEALRFWPVRRELLEIAELAGAPSLPRYALRLMVGQGLGVITMLLLAIRFLALGEALQRPGNVLSGLHTTILGIAAFYSYLVRIIFGGA